MPKQQLKTRIFGENETLDDLTAAQEELGDPATPPEPTPPEPPPAEPPPAEPPAEPPAQETRADRRIQQLLEERATLQRQMSESNERWARLDERRKQVQEAQGAAAYAAQQQAQAAERPDPNIDPVGARLYDIQKQNEQLLAWKQQQEQNFAQLQQSVQQTQYANDFNGWVIAEAQNFTRQQPDYPDAAQYAANWRMNWWQELGLPPDAARQLVLQESQLLAQVSARSGKPFAPAIYKLAQSVGYKPVNGNGHGAVGAPSPAAATNAARVLNQVRNGQAMQGLSRVPAAGGGNASRYRDMTAAEISAVSERQWQRDWANPALRADMEYALRKLDQLEDQEVSYQGRR